MRISDLQAKDVINIVDGKKLGHVSDMEFDLHQGRIEALMIPSSSKWLGWFSGGDEVVIHWQQIVKIGADVILIRLESNKSLHEDFMDTTMEPIKPLRKV